MSTDDARRNSLFIVPWQRAVLLGLLIALACGLNLFMQAYISLVAEQDSNEAYMSIWIGLHVAMFVPAPALALWMVLSTLTAGRRVSIAVLVWIALTGSSMAGAVLDLVNGNAAHESMINIAVFTTQVVVMSLPLVLLRWKFRWVLLPSGPPHRANGQGVQFSLLTMMVWTFEAALAMMLFLGLARLGRSNAAATLNFKTFIEAADQLLMVCVISLPTLPLAWLALSRGFGRMMGMLLSAAALAAMVVLMYLASTSATTNIQESIKHLIAIWVGVSAAAAVALGTYWACGYRLVRLAGASTSSEISVSEVAVMHPDATIVRRWLPVRFVAALSLLTTLSLPLIWCANKVIPIWMQHTREKRYEELGLTMSSTDESPAQLVSVLVAPTQKIGEAQISALRELGEIPILSMNSSQAATQQLQTLCKLSHVRCLVLGSSSVIDADLDNVTRIASLNALNLSKTAVTDAGLVKLRQLRHLEYVDLAGTSITDRGLRELQEIRTLRTILVRGTSVTPEGLEELREALPETQIDGP